MLLNPHWPPDAHNLIQKCETQKCWIIWVIMFQWPEAHRMSITRSAYHAEMSTFFVQSLSLCPSRVHTESIFRREKSLKPTRHDNCDIRGLYLLKAMLHRARMTPHIVSAQPQLDHFRYFPSAWTSCISLHLIQSQVWVEMERVSSSRQQRLWKVYDCTTAKSTLLDLELKLYLISLPSTLMGPVASSN